MMTQPPENITSPPRVDKNVVWMPVKAGCLTFAVAGVALLAGYLLDARLETFPRWTLIMLIGSAPFTLGGVYWLVRHTLKRQRKEQGEDVKPKDDNNDEPVNT